eukprot:1111055_1
MDSTFMDRKCVFQSKIDSIKEIIGKIHAADQLAATTNKAVHFFIQSILGTEEILLEVAKEFQIGWDIVQRTKAKIERHDELQRSGIKNAETLFIKENSTWLHAIAKDEFLDFMNHHIKESEESTADEQILPIFLIPSTQYFVMPPHERKKVPGLDRVLWSMHSDLAELCRFVKHLRPKRVIPFVMPSWCTSTHDLAAFTRNTFDKFLRKDPAPPPQIRSQAPPKCAKSSPEPKQSDVMSQEEEDALLADLLLGAKTNSPIIESASLEPGIPERAASSAPSELPHQIGKLVGSSSSKNRVISLRKFLITELIPQRRTGCHPQIMHRQTEWGQITVVQSRKSGHLSHRNIRIAQKVENVNADQVT